MAQPLGQPQRGLRMARIGRPLLETNQHGFHALQQAHGELGLTSDNAALTENHAVLAAAHPALAPALQRREARAAGISPGMQAAGDANASAAQQALQRLPTLREVTPGPSDTTVNEGAAARVAEIQHELGVASAAQMQRQNSRASEHAIHAQGVEAHPRVAAAELPGLGGQLTRRVGEGTISQNQAVHTAHEREVLANAYGADWRDAVYGAPDKMHETREALNAHPNNTRLRQAYETLIKARAKAMLHALGSRAVTGPASATP